MIQYILECIAFQLMFLVIYDFFLKKETFFQWNRVYLIATYILSVILPWIKIEAFNNAVPQQFYLYPEYLWGTNDASAVVGAEGASFTISIEYVVFFGGMFLAALVFGYKILQLYRLRKKGEVHYFSDFTQIIIANSNLAFSFFRSIFLGDKVLETEHDNIIQHELVHIEQRHSLDLLFFEIMRIVGWFNPLVYVYQNRVSELHEFIADDQVAKTDKKEQYQLLLSQVFQTENISFINQFFKSSLIKKRILMLQKSESKKIWRLKYLLMLPLVFGMLAYTSYESKELNVLGQEQTTDDSALIDKVTAKINREINELGSLRKVYMRHFNNSFFGDSEGPIVSKEVYFESSILFRMNMQEMWEDWGSEKSAQIEGYLNRILPPSTARYESYVSRKKAFQILDENLKYSIRSEDENRGYGVRQINNDYNYSNNSYELQVGDVRDLTGDEIRKFNNKMDEIFKKENSTYSSLILKDNRYRFQVFAAKPIIAINTFPKVSTSIKKKQVNVNSQETWPDVPFAVVDEVPIFPGCEDAEDPRACFNKMIQKHISKNFRYPEEAQEKGIQGRVSVLFVIMEDGSIQNIKMRGPDKLLEEEVERIIKKLPKMTAGKHKGEAVRVPFSIPITFKLEGDVDVNHIGLVNKYNLLAKERNRLLLKANQENPIIVNLDQQILAIEKRINENSEGDFLNNNVPFAVVEVVPIFPGCEGEEDSRACFKRMVQKYISENFRYPEEAQEKGIQGRVSIMFIIQKDGSIGNLRMKGPDKLLEKEAARIIGKLPKMTAGKHKGKAVRVPFSMPITFKLQ